MAQVLVATTLRQKEAKRYEEAEAGRYRPAAPAALAGGQAPEQAIAAEAERVRQKHERLRAAVAGAAADEAAVAAGAAPGLERALAHAAALIEL